MSPQEDNVILDCGLQIDNIFFCHKLTWNLIYVS